MRKARFRQRRADRRIPPAAVKCTAASTPFLSFIALSIVDILYPGYYYLQWAWRLFSGISGSHLMSGTLLKSVCNN